MGHNSCGGGQSLEEQILTYMAKCRNENREQFLWIKGKLEENSEQIKELKADFVKFKEHSASVNSWADVYDYNKEEEQDVLDAPPSPGCFFRRNEEGSMEGNDTSYDSTSQGEITVDEGNSILKADGSIRGDGEGIVELERMSSLGDEGGNREQNDEIDDEVQILDEVVVTRKAPNEPMEPGPSNRLSAGSNGRHGENARRPSIFTSVKRAGTECEGPRSSQQRQMADLSDSFNLNNLYNEGNTPESSTADGDVGDINEIFEGVFNSSEPPPPILSPAVSKRKSRTDDQRSPRKIKRIAKAPIKEEPIQSTSFSYVHDDLLSFAGSPQHALPSPPLSNHGEDTEEVGNVEQPQPPHPPILPCLIKDIKVERVAHAIKDNRPDTQGRYFCICGHFCYSKGGIQSHVTHKGCEEPRFLCPEHGCEKKCVYAYDIRNHLQSFHGKITPELHGCKKCSSYFYDRHALKDHKRAGNCKKHSSRRKGQAVELNRAPTAASSSGTSSSANTNSVIRGLPRQSSPSALGRPSQIITM